MTFVAKPQIHHPSLRRNDLGLTRRDYEGSVSTLCAGCGHDSVSASVVQACAELSLPPHRFVKVSGIGCSSKTPSYFLNKSHGFNSVHGRMPSVMTGANLANRDLMGIGVSGDGDSASIGLGQFAHIVRRRINMLYLVDNNGTYGLTKGQFSATNDKGSTSKKGIPNLYEPIDLVSMALQLGASLLPEVFWRQEAARTVDKGRSETQRYGIYRCDFSLCGFQQPCWFNEELRIHSRSPRYAVNADLILTSPEVTADYEEGAREDVAMPDGSTLRLYKLDADYDPHDRVGALNYVQKMQEEGTVVTGLLYVDTDPVECHDIMGTVKTPLAELTEKELCPGGKVLDSINESFG